MVLPIASTYNGKANEVKIKFSKKKFAFIITLYIHICFKALGHFSLVLKPETIIQHLTITQKKMCLPVLSEG